LFGPRGVGKSTWLREVVPQAVWFDLLDPQLQLSLQLAPSGLREQTEHLRAGSWVCIDEVQKAPALLDEVHALIERKRLKFALTGSSARKLRRGGANLLAGRASVLAMRPFSLRELGDVPVKPLLQFGGLPLVINEPQAATDILRAYVSTYLREEIREEGLVRKVEPFVRFLRVAGLMNAQIVNASNIARDAQVPRNSVVSYFSILEDTLVATRLPSFQPGARVRETAHPKFYWFDPGVARAAAGLLDDPIDNVWSGYAFETWLLHELLVYNETQRRHREIFYYQTGAGVEVDFVVETRKKTLSSPAEVVLIEVKLADRWRPDFDKHLREVSRSANFKVKACVGVYLGRQRLRREEIDVFPLSEFIGALYDGQFF
jgi:predicted AAA+ superfamily ATPase